jgi:hypothetical protein
MKRFRLGKIAQFLAGVLAATGAQAYDFSEPPPGFAPGDINTFYFFLADKVTYDDNLFRIPPNVAGVPGAVFPDATQYDAVNTTSLGGQGRWALGRQNVQLDLRIDENRFDHNDALNFVSGNAVGTWDWRLGPYLSGNVKTFYDRSLAGFSQTRFSGKDLITSLEELGYARYQIGPHWAAYAQLRGAYSDNSAEQEQFNNFHEHAGYTGVEYATNVNDTFGFEYQYININFKAVPAGSPAGYDYDEDTGKFLAKYAITDKTSLDGYAGYIKRKYPGLPIGAYSGDIWRGTFTWTPTEKTTLAVSSWHELHAYIDQESNYFVAKGGSVEPGWSPTEKINLTMAGSYEKQNYISGSSSVVTTGARNDKVSSGQLTLRYTPRSAWTLIAFYRHEKRDSNQFVYSFNDNIVSGNVTFRFW